MVVRLMTLLLLVSSNLLIGQKLEGISIGATREKRTSFVKSKMKLGKIRDKSASTSLWSLHANLHWDKIRMGIGVGKSKFSFNRRYVTSEYGIIWEESDIIYGDIVRGYNPKKHYAIRAKSKVTYFDIPINFEYSLFENERFRIFFTHQQTFKIKSKEEKEFLPSQQSMYRRKSLTYKQQFDEVNAPKFDFNLSLGTGMSCKVSKRLELACNVGIAAPQSKVFGGFGGLRLAHRGAFTANYLIFDNKK